MDEQQKVILTVQAYCLMVRFVNNPTLWARMPVKFHLRLLKRYLRRYHALTDEGREAYEIGFWMAGES